jgi:hypothetical protein
VPTGDDRASAADHQEEGGSALDPTLVEMFL